MFGQGSDDRITEPRWLDDREQAVWRGYMQMQARLSAQLYRSMAADSGMSEGDYAVLVCLSEAPDGRLRAFELGRLIEWEKSRLSHQLTRMERRGMVVRAECPSDARGAFIVITAAGRAAIEQAAPRHVADVRRWFIDVLDEAQLDALAGIIDAVLTSLGEPPVPPECPNAVAEAAAEAMLAAER